MNAIAIVVLIFSLFGAVDYLIGNKIGIGQEFSKAFSLFDLVGNKPSYLAFELYCSACSCARHVVDGTRYACNFGALGYNQFPLQTRELPLYPQKIGRAQKDELLCESCR